MKSFTVIFGLIYSFLLSFTSIYGQELNIINQTLAPNQTIEREMTGAETHRYKFSLQASEFFQVRVEQKGVDVALKLLDADGKTLATMDSPNSKDGTETLSFIAENGGSFILEVSGFDAKAEKGNYSIKRIASRTAMAADKRRVEVEKLFVEGMTARDSDGQGEVSIAKLSEALKGWQELKDDYLVGLTLNQVNQLKKSKADLIFNEAFSLFQQGTLESYQKATAKFGEAGKLYEEIGDQSENAGVSVLVMGLIADRLGDKQAALKYDEKALTFFKANKYPDLEATTLSNIGAVYSDLGEKQKALDYFQSSLPLSKAVGDKAHQANTLDWLRYYWNSSKNTRFAVFYGKQSINLYQELRQNIQGLDKEIQKTYLKSIEYNYRDLADILIAEGRIAEAEQVLGMLKEEEYLTYLRRDDAVAKDLKGRISLSPDEKQAFDDYEKYSAEITKTAEDFGVLEKKKNALPLGESLTAEDQKQYDLLKSKYDAAVTVFNKYLDDLKVKFAANGDKSKQVAVVESDTIGLLKRLNQPHTVIISTIAGEDRLNLIVTTSDIQKAHTVEIKAADLNKLVADFREAVKNPKVDPRPLGKQLYDKLFPAELQQDLANIKADTIVWSLDGTLRYVPMAALWDGKQYLAERYNNAVLTLASRDKLGQNVNSDRQKWLAFGVGVSKAFETFNALPAVPQELCSVVNDAKKKEFCQTFGNKSGVLNGLMLTDDDFTLTGFQNNLGKTAVVHIASHFSLNAGNEIDSYLLLGGGTNRRFTLDNLRKTRLDNVELLTLSACNTAMTAGANSSGVEVEGFGALAQNQGAKTVLATLWAVADDSTRDLMTEFYRTLETDSKSGKAESLRKAQLALLQGKYKTGETPLWKRGAEIVGGNATKQPEFKTDPNAPFAHPYFWSPFVLIGRWN